MRIYHRLGLFALASAVPVMGQTSCAPDAAASAAKTVAAIRHELHGQAVPALDPHVPPSIAAQLGKLKDALASTAEAAFACADGSATPENIEKTLTRALGIDPPSEAETPGTRGKQDFGAYGSDLSVQAFQLFGHPKFLEVDFRYGLECGDDNLLLVFEAADDSPATRWRERLRWEAPSYNTVSDALGDFIMLTPLTGSYKAPTWRFVVVHGHPGCGTSARPSHFDLDLLSPTTDPRKPHVDAHFEHPYLEDHVVPRLATTEDTVDFRILHEAKPTRTAPAPQSVESYRFHLNASGLLEPTPVTTDEGSTGAPATTGKAPSATANSPQ